jgi:small-conductance mechanosensitive channel
MRAAFLPCGTRLRGWLAAPAMALLLLAAAPATAQQHEVLPTASAEPTPEQVRSLVQLLSDPVVKGWLERQMQAAGPAAPALPTAGAGETGLSGFLERRVQVWRGHLQELSAALPGLPGELATATGRLEGALADRGLVEVVLLLAGFIGLGFGVELLFWRATAAFRARFAAAPVVTAADRVRLVLSRFLFGLAWIVSFALGSIGAFLLFPWPPALRVLVLGYLAAFLALRVMLVLGRFLFAPGEERLRVVPMGDDEARLWHRWSAAFVGWLAFGYVTIEVLLRLGTSMGAAAILAYLLGLALLAIALRLVWRPGTATAGRIAGSVLAVLVWASWVAGAKLLMWTLIVGSAVPLAMGAAHRAVLHLFRPDDTASAGEAAPVSAWAVVVDRGARALLIIAGIAVLAWGWGLDLIELTARDTPAMRLINGALHAVIILLVADLLWQLARTAIDRQLHVSGAPDEHEHEPGHGPDLSEEEQRRRSRIRTLLPVLRIVLFVVLSVMAVLMALSALGVQIAPLIAGAGVVGVAIGFGSQTLVKDIISGMFYLLDDAFRVGEYIVSGTFRGTVEGFSLRSIKLRHHRGSLFTVPFGTLGAVQNLSRDWVIDKLTFNVPFDTDIALVKKVIKQVSKEIMDDSTLAKGILEPLKSQGVATMGDFAMQLRVKFKTRPGEQFAVRRAAYDRIKRAFAANGIKFAVPTVQVAGGAEGPAAPALAQHAISMIEKPAAE